MAEAAQFERPADTPFDRHALRRALGAFATGVTIVTGRDANRAPVGFTANSFTSVSLDPPLVLACIGAGAASYAAFRGADAFAVNILTAGQRDLAMRFATRGADKFAGGAWETRATGAPVLADSAAWFDCAAHQTL
ncbi:MAG: flavin reductase family protein, partial [Rubrimonas sp.]